MSALDPTLDLGAPSCRRRHQLSRLLAGELVAVEAAEARMHLEGCTACQATWRELESEDLEVRRELPLSKLEAGLTAPAKVVPLRRLARVAPTVALALAAGIAGLVLLPRLASNPVSRTKGGIGLDVFVGGIGEPRRVDGHDVALGPGERMQLKVHGNGHRYVAVLSVDDDGGVSPIYFAGDQSLPLEAADGFLPKSIDFYGRGRERLIVLFSDAPLARPGVEQAAHDAFEKAGDLQKMGQLGLEGRVEELDRVVLKPEVQ